jgi:hypothetical protein
MADRAAPVPRRAPAERHFARSTASRFATSKATVDVHALLFSPWPESVFRYQPVWSRLAATAHPVAVISQALAARSAGTR